MKLISVIVLIAFCCIANAGKESGGGDKIRRDVLKYGNTIVTFLEDPRNKNQELLEDPNLIKPWLNVNKIKVIKDFPRSYEGGQYYGNYKDFCQFEDGKIVFSKRSWDTSFGRLNDENAASIYSFILLCLMLPSSSPEDAGLISRNFENSIDIYRANAEAAANSIFATLMDKKNADIFKDIPLSKLKSILRYDNVVFTDIELTQDDSMVDAKVDYHSQVLYINPTKDMKYFLGNADRKNLYDPLVYLNPKPELNSEQLSSSRDMLFHEMLRLAEAKYKDSKFNDDDYQLTFRLQHIDWSVLQP